MLTVGEFSKICQVSVKTLHHYDKIGLLRPQKVDPLNGYRYYGKEQVEQMLLIGRLKRYGFSLTEMEVMLAEKQGQELFVQLSRQKLRLERQMAHLSLTIQEMEQHLREFERTGDIISYQKKYEVRVRESEEQPILTRRQKMSVEEFGAYYGKIFERIAREGLNPDGVTLAIYHDQEFDPACSDIELGVGIREREQADKTLPVRTCAVTIHKGAYAGLPDAYGAIVSWIHANGWAIDGAPYEIYRKTFREGLPPQEWETEIFFPVKRV